MEKVKKQSSQDSFNEKERLKSLQDYSILYTLPEAAFDSLTRLAAYVCDTPIALISLLDAEKQWFKSSVGIDICETERDISFCKYTIQGMEVFEISNTLEHELVKNHPMVTGEPYIRFYAGAPLTTPAGYNIGTICVIDTKPKKLSDKKKEALQTLSREIINNLELRVQKQKQQEQIQHLEKYQMWFSHTKELMCMVDASTFLFEEVNQSFNLLLGYELHEMKGKHLSDIFYKEDFRTLKSLREKGLHDNLEVMEFETRVVCKDGSLKWFSWNAVSKNGKWYADGRDITESKNLKILLQSTESMAHVGGWELNVNSGQFFGTEQTYQILELPLNTLISVSKNSGFNLCKIIPEITQIFENVITKQESFDIELPFITAKRNHKWARFIGSPVIEHNEVVILRGSFQDITQRKEVEAQQTILLTKLESSNRELRQKESYLKEINILATNLLNRNESEEIDWALPTHMLKELGVASCAIYLIDETREYLIQKAVYTTSGLQKFTRKKAPVKITLSNGILGSVALSGVPKIIDDLTKDAGNKTVFKGLHSAIAIPILADGVVMGVICASHTQLNYFATQHVEILSTVANLFASSVKNAINIYKKKITDQALRESEAQTRLIIDTALDGVIMMNSEGVITNWNTQAATIFGWSKEEVINNKLMDLIVPESFREAHWLGLHRYLKTGDQVILNKRIEITALRKNGEEFPLELAVSPIHLESGIFFSAFARDIFEKNKAKQELEFISSRLTALIKNLQTGILVEDDKRDIVIVNQPFCDMFGIKANPEVMSGINCAPASESVKHLFKDPEAFVERIPLLMREKKVYIGEQMEMANGQYFERDYIPIFSGEKFLGTLWQYTDVTARKSAENKLKKSEEKYKSIIDHMKLGVVELNKQQRITVAYERFCQMTGYAQRELIGKHVTEVMPQSNVYLNHDGQNEPLSGVYEIQIRKKDSKLMWVLVSVAHLYDNHQRISGAICIHLDITEQKSIEADLLKERRKAEESSKAKETFLANMSHEIRTPMNAIIGMASLIGNTPLTSKQNNYVNAIKTSANNLLVIINDVLDLTKIESGKLTLENIGFKLEEQINSLIQSLGYKAEEKGIILSTYIDKGINQVLIGDPVRLNQVLLNLVNNAIKFTNEGYVELQCNLVGETNTVQAIEFKVIDTGIGISQHKLQTIYESFSQEDESITRRFGGTGLGLTISKQIAEIMGGNIKVESEKGKGSIFSFYVQLTKGITEDLHTVKEEKKNVNLCGVKVLLAEDHDINRLLAISILHEWKVSVDIAENGLIAVEKAKYGNYDIVLMDMQMPVMSGIEATRLIRNELKLSIPIIALTANASKADFEKCVKAGMNDYISKPFNPVTLFNKIADLLNIEVVENNQNDPLHLPNGHIKLYDLSRLQQMSNGNSAFVQNMVTIFKEKTPATIEQLNDHYKHNRLDKVATIAHQLKPSIDFMGIDALTTEIRLLEKCNEAAQIEVQDAIDKLNQVLDIVFNQLENQTDSRTIK